MTGSSLQRKIRTLSSLLQGMGPVAVAFSGGVDSTFLLAVAQGAMPENVVAITAVNCFFSDTETRRAVRIAGQLGVAMIKVDADPLVNTDISGNGPERCYHCKKFLYGNFLKKLAVEGGPLLIHGATMEDLRDYRPGNRAAHELGVAAPLVEAGLTKVEIRQASRQMGLETCDLPSNACLASRIPYHTPISEKGLQQVEQAEAILARLGFGTNRVRHHGQLARIEFASKEDMQKAVGEGMRESLLDALKAVGFRFLSLDLEGYRQGSMNRVL